MLNYAFCNYDQCRLAKVPLVLTVSRNHLKDLHWRRSMIDFLSVRSPMSTFFKSFLSTFISGQMTHQSRWNIEEHSDDSIFIYSHFYENCFHPHNTHASHHNYSDTDAIPVHVEEPLVLVHPDLGHASRVDPVRVVGDEVRVERTEDVTDVAGE